MLNLNLHDRLMTNANRFIRKLTDDPRCLVCGEVEENVEHILRKCPIATMVWRKFPGINDHEIFGKPLTEWIAQNTGPYQTRDEHWPTVFCTTLWWLWKWRNNRVFDREAEVPVDQLGYIMIKVKQIITAMERNERVEGRAVVRRTSTFSGGTQVRVG